MSEQNDETADGCEMLTATSDPVVIYQALCWATDEIEQLKRERDEALSQIVQAECRAERFCQERDEARNEILGWRNKWECAVEMAAMAEFHHDRLVKELENLYDKLKSQRS